MYLCRQELAKVCEDKKEKHSRKCMLSKKEKSENIGIK